MPSGYKCSQEEVIARFRKVHGDKFDYSQVNYKKMHTPVLVECPIHGFFETPPSRHLCGHGCPYCAGKNHTSEWAIQRAKEVHGNKYEYLPFEFINNKSVMTIVCPEHGPFTRTVQQHINDHSGCPECRSRKRYTKDSFVRESQKVHGDKYDYIGEYVDTQTKIAIRCKKHNYIFSPIPADHLRGSGCPICSESHGERQIAKWLDEHNMSYQRQYKLVPSQVLFGRNMFRIDFFLPQYNTFIEYHGRQHYERVEIWHTEEQFAEQQDRDRRMREYCKQHKINLIEISYKESDKIDKILSKKIGSQL